MTTGVFVQSRRQVLLFLGVLSVTMTFALYVALTRIEHPRLGMALVLLTLTPFLLARRGWQFLNTIEAQPGDPPAGSVTLAYQLMFTYPLAMSAFLMIVLAEM